MMVRCAPVAVFHYEEIGLKGNNRPWYERVFQREVTRHLSLLLGTQPQTHRRYQRVIARLDSPEALEVLIRPESREHLGRVPGIAWWGIGFAVPSALDAIVYAARRLVAVNPQDHVSFRVRASRVDKFFPLTSPEIAQKVGEELRVAYPQWSVSLKNAARTYVVEVLPEEAFVLERAEGVGGLPVGTSGKAVALISAGFDSPVASFLALKRGVRVLCAHFHAGTFTGEQPRRIVRSLVAHLARHTTPLRLGWFNVSPITQRLLHDAPEKLRVILLRRSMVRLASRWAQQHHALALVTGESVGQVASQTLSNMAAIEAATTLPIIRPLAGMNKNEIVSLARWLGTAPLSSQRCADTCAQLTPAHPATRSDPAVLAHWEEELGITAREGVVWDAREEEVVEGGGGDLHKVDGLMVA